MDTTRRKKKVFLKNGRSIVTGLERVVGRDARWGKKGGRKGGREEEEGRWHKKK